MTENAYFIFVVILFLLAVFDLIIGVSNDAVNFLNSSIGSRVAKRKTILIIAGAGVLFGAVFSGGMMEVARKGIFNPEMFVFSELMVVFMAVMLTDIILLDMFNTFGMPTSTTVSIVFELLGAAFAVSMIKIFSAGGELADLTLYLNHSKALQIIGGIFLSIFFAFAIGWLIMSFSRIVFSFDLRSSVKKYGAVFGGLAITTIVYFILIKGAKGSTLISNDLLLWINENTLLLIGVNFVFWTILSLIGQRVFKLSILRFVVLSGTFALAMAFASNDLVNFIGVPIAGFESYIEFAAGTIPADEMNMGFLANKVKTDPLLLILAGLIMVVTLVFSKKARTVTETEVNLGRQGFGSERFRPNYLSRSIVQMGVSLASVFSGLMPASMKQRLSDKFVEIEIHTDLEEEDKPAFDLLRASVNLVVASILIAFATSLKLPLSTTYVSFMVAMGASLADYAWDRESAVYRVAGVLSVIGGWLFTAIIAFTSAATLALMIFYGELYMVIGLTLLAAFLIMRSAKFHSKRMKEKPTLIASIIARKNIKADEVINECLEHIDETLSTTDYVFKKCILGLSEEDKQIIKKARKRSKGQDSKIDQLSRTVFHYVQKMESENGEMAQFYIYVLRYLTNIKKSIIQISTISYKHIDNVHKPMEIVQIEELFEIYEELSAYISLTKESLSEMNTIKYNSIAARKESIYQSSVVLLERQIMRMKSRSSSRESSVLHLSIILESQSLLRYISDLAELFIQKTKK